MTDDQLPVHALLSASGSATWLACAAAIERSRGLPEQTSPFAEEGRQAHECAELLLLGKDVPEHLRHFIPEVQPYVDYVRLLFAETTKLFVEERLDYSEWVPGGFGTADAVVIELDSVMAQLDICEEPIASGEAHIVDLKFGKGVKVFASTPQLKLYALGVLSQYQWEYGIDTITAHIVQPRLDHTDSVEYKASDLLDWAENTVRPAAALALQDGNPATPGESQCRWCRARHTCRERVVYMLSQVPGSPTISPAELGALIPVAEEVKAWSTHLLDYARQQAAAGAAIPGHKLVAGRGARKWTTEAPEILAQYLPEDDIYEKKLLGVTAITKLLGGKKIADPVLDLATVSSPGKPTLVANSDPRPAIEASTSPDSFPIGED
jgi:hypothetical protein